jgi:hypothetical protein
MAIEQAFPPDVNIYDGAPPGKSDPYTGITRKQYTDSFGTKTTNWEDPTPVELGQPERREILMPIINQSEFDAGKDEVKFTKFGKFFMNRKVGGIPSNPEIYVEFMDMAKGVGGLDPDGGPASPIVVPVLYR